ncbi:hypothetical protein RB594_003220 [Gaeumannomyces avenae]
MADLTVHPKEKDQVYRREAAAVDEDATRVVGTTQLYREDGRIRLIPMPTPDPRDPLNLPVWRKRFAVSILCFFGALALGIASPYIAANHSWRWIYWVTTGFGAVTWALLLLLLPETRWTRSKEELMGHNVYDIAPDEDRPQLDTARFRARSAWDDVGVFNCGFEWREAGVSMLDTLRTTFLPVVLSVTAANSALLGWRFELTGLGVLPFVAAALFVIFAYLTVLTLGNVLAVESYPMWAGPVLVNVGSMRITVAFFLASRAVEWVQAAGPLATFAMYGEALLVIALGIPALFFCGKRLRAWTAGRVGVVGAAGGGRSGGGRTGLV